MNEKIIKLRESGLFSDEIADRLKMDKLDIDLELVEHYYQVKGDKQQVPKEIYIVIVTNRHNGIPITLSAKQFHLSDSGISRKLKMMGIRFPAINHFDYSYWTTENIKRLVDDFNSGIPVYKLVEKYGFHKNALAKIINENGGNTTQVSFNAHFFDKIDTEEKAYWLGFLFADGSVAYNNNDIELSLQILDAEHLNKFKEALKATRSQVRLDFKIMRCRFNMSNENFKNALIDKGCTPRKSLTLNISDDVFSSSSLIIPFIRGYFDGDGCLTHNYSDERKQRFTVSTGFVGTRAFLEWVERHLEPYDIHFNWFHNKRNNEATWIVNLNKTDSVKLLNLIYTDANIYLTRKYEKYKFFANHDNFAVYVSDYIEYNRAISENAKSWIKNNICSDFEERYANAEITKKRNGFLAS